MIGCRKWIAILAGTVTLLSPSAGMTQPSPGNIVGGTRPGMYDSGIVTAFLYEVPSGNALILTDLCWSPAQTQALQTPSAGDWAASVWLEDSQVRWQGAACNSTTLGTATWTIGEHFTTGIVFQPGASAYVKMTAAGPGPMALPFTVTWSGYLVPISTSAVQNDAPEGDFALRAFPNPSGQHVVLEFRLARTQRAELALFDASGRRVCRLAGGEFQAGVHNVAWDGRDDKGRNTPAGTYFAKLETRDRSQVRSLLYMR